MNKDVRGRHKKSPLLQVGGPLYRGGLCSHDSEQGAIFSISIYFNTRIKTQKQVFFSALFIKDTRLISNPGVNSSIGEKKHSNR